MRSAAPPVSCCHAPAQELAARYQSRWTIETTFAELKTTLKGADIVLRSKTPELVKQEFWGLLLAGTNRQICSGRCRPATG